MAYGTVNADVIGTSVVGSNLGAGNASLLKNRLINGDMRIDQRNAGASVTVLTTTGYTLDRWTTLVSASSKFSVQQNAGSVTPPVGFTNYLGCTSLSAYSLAVGDYFTLRQAIEGYNCADLGWGTANAKTITISFQVYSSLTGTFGGALQNNTSARSYPFTYTVSSANTWTTVSVTVAGDTSGTWQTGVNTGIFVYFGLGVGSTYSGTAGSWSGTNYVGATGATSVVGTSGATFYITGVQLEVGSSATGFEYVNYQTSLANCQRYFDLISSGNGYSIGISIYNEAAVLYLPFRSKVSMRTAPTAYQVTGTNYFTTVANADAFNGFDAIAAANENGGVFYATSNVSGTIGYATDCRTNNASAKIALSAEL
jgi:hypothetical protein